MTRVWKSRMQPQTEIKTYVDVQAVTTSKDTEKKGQEEEVAEIVAEVAEILSDADLNKLSCTRNASDTLVSVSVQKGGRWRKASKVRQHDSTSAIQTETAAYGIGKEEVRSGSTPDSNGDVNREGFIYFTGGHKEARSGYRQNGTNNASVGCETKNESRSKEVSQAQKSVETATRKQSSTESQGVEKHSIRNPKEGVETETATRNPSSTKSQRLEEHSSDIRNAQDHEQHAIGSTEMQISKLKKTRETKAFDRREERMNGFWHSDDDDEYAANIQMQQEESKNEEVCIPRCTDGITLEVSEANGTETATKQQDSTEADTSGEFSDGDGMRNSEDHEEHAMYCFKCSQAYLVNVDLLRYKSNFTCADLNRACNRNQIAEKDGEDGNASKEKSAGREADASTNNACGDGEDCEFFAVCDRCGETRVTFIDFMGLDLGFTCHEVGESCVGVGDETGTDIDIASAKREPLASDDPSEADLEELSDEEKRDLFARYGVQRLEEKLKAEDVQHGVLQLFATQPQQQRYRNDEIVTRKGERFIQVKVSLDPGPGCQIGGIMGWRSKAGRRGLGIRKMDKEEADRICVSNKQRSHTRTATGPGGSKISYAFENKWSQHTAGSSQGQAPQSLGKSSTAN